jgi:O-succinylbenzoic acid--CoA ligase
LAGRNVTLSIFAAAGEAPAREALVCGLSRPSFSELSALVAQRCHELAAQGVRPLQREPVALIVDGSPAMFEFLYALLALGVPVLPLNPRLTQPEREALRRASKATLLLDPASSAPAVPALAPPALPLIPAAQPLAIVPSSGSSGAPKLVELSHGAFLALARADALRVPALTRDRALLCLPLSHVGGLSVVIRSLLARRTCVAFPSPKGGLLHGVPELAHTIERERISLLSLVPAVLARLLREMPKFGEKTALRAVLLGGQACAPELFEQARERGLPVLTSYGLTEMCSQVSTLGFPPPLQVPVRKGVVSSGFPLAGVELRVQAGRIQVRGPTLFTRYLGSGAALDDEGFFDTADRGELDPEHGLFVFGRESELIISGGENIDPSEVEHALLSCPGIEAACVFGVADPEFGERVAAALESRSGAPIDERALFIVLDERLASFKQPRALCVFSELPRLGSGKLDRTRIVTEAGARLHRPRRV